MASFPWSKPDLLERLKLMRLTLLRRRTACCSRDTMHEQEYLDYIDDDDLHVRHGNKEDGDWSLGDLDEVLFHIRDFLRIRVDGNEELQ
jgi:hypothetical protein